MNQNKTSGFFPIVDSGPWAFLFPIHISNELLLINIISQEEYLTQLYKILDSFTQNYKIISTVDLDNIDQYDKNIWKSAIPYPKFTKRQIDIASYAARNGYFKSPKKISGRQIADYFKISVTAVNKHLKKARNIAMEYFFGSF
jgi:predicted DNA binding protein